MMRIGLVTCSKEPQLIAIDNALIPIFESYGVTAIPVIWNDPNILWNEYDYLILRSVWDYHLHSSEFLKWLDFLDDFNIPVLNPTSIIRRNHHKFYLQELMEVGVSIIPTQFISKKDDFNLAEVSDQGWNRAVIKPAISASSYLTSIFNMNDISTIEDRYHSVAKERDFLVQKFMPEVQTYGELSLLFFNRKYSHAVLKTAKKNEFRVQEEYGGIIKSYNPSTDLINQATQILSHFNGDILQARVDGVIRNGTLTVMEVELIEPYLFFEYDDEARGVYVQQAIEIMEKF